MRPPGTLAWLILGILDQEPMSGYDIRMLFRDSPLRTYSNSPGAIYPALRSLEARGYVRSAATDSARRERRAYRPTARGRRALLSWVRTPVVNDENGRFQDGLFEAKLAFMSDLLQPVEILPLLHAHVGAVNEQLEHVRAWEAAHAVELSVSGRLALQFGIAKLEAASRWLEESMRTLNDARR